MVVYNNVLAGAAGSGGDGYKIERSLRFNIDDSAYLHRQNSSSTTSSAKKFTLSFWVKRVDSASNRHVFFSAPSLNSWSNWTTLYFMSSGQLQLEPHISQGRITTAAKYLDYSAWSHFVLSVDSTLSTAADRIKIFHNGVRQAVTGTNANQDQTFAYGLASNYQQIGFNNSSYGMNGYLADMHFVDDQALDPTEFGEYDEDTGVWNPKKFSGTHGVNGWHLDFSDNSSNAALGTDSSGNNNTWTVNNITASATATGTVSGTGTPANASGSGGWAQAFDGSTSTLVYNSNGSTTTTFTFDTPLAWTNSIRIYAGQNGTSGTNIIANGVNLSSSITWNLTGEWKEVSSALTSPLTSLALTSVGGSSSNIRAVEIDGTVIVQANPSDIDSLLDSPTNYEASSGNNGGNYAVMNPLSKRDEVFTDNGNLDLSVTSGSDSWSGRKAFSTIGVTSGKWYAEMTVNTVGSVYAAICGNTENINESASIGWQSQGWGYYQGGIIVIQSTEYSSGIPAYTTGDIIGVALDVDNLKVKWYKNGTQVGTTAGYDITPDLRWFFAFDSYDASNVSWNFGQRPFAISSVPTGHKALCTQNFDDPLIVDSSTAMDAALYTGNGSTQTVSGLNMSPDLVWIKCRSNSQHHVLTDSVRGTSAQLFSDITNSEGSATDQVTAFNSDGFSLGANSSGTGGVNINTSTYVAWAWDGGDLVQSSNSLQTETWSAATGALAAESFDGNTNTQGYMANEQWYKIAGSLTVSSSMRIYLRKDEQYKMRINGGTEFNANTRDTSVSNNYDWAAISISTGTHTNVEIKITGGGGYINAIEVDGKIMCDPGNIPVGSLNSSAYNTSQTWSGNLSVNTGSISNATQAFNGNLSNGADSSASTGSNDRTMSAQLGLTLNNEYVEVYPNHTYSGYYATIDGTNQPIQYITSTNGFQKMGPYTGTLTGVTVTNGTDSSNRPAGIRAIRVGGKILVDTNVTPPNLPSIASTVRANTSAGVSIVTYSQGAAGSFVGHGLNKNPDMIIAKTRSLSTQPWVVYHSALGKGGVVQLHNTDANNTTYPTYWGHREPDSNVFGLYTASAPWANNAGDMAAWCFTSIEGYSAFGKYDGTGSTNGQFVYTGFRPRWVMHKRIDGGGTNVGDWRIWDTARDVDNAAESILFPNKSGVEATNSAHGLDILSNGFKFKTSDSNINANGATYLYAAFAENPFKYARAR